MTRYLTRQGLEKLKKELDELEKIGRKEIAEKIRQTAAFGDLKENFAYHEAKDAQGFLEGRIAELKGIVANAKVIESKNTDVVQIGSTVSLLADGKTEEFQIVGPEEADVFCGKISYKSPLGELVLGKAKGNKVVMETSGGKTAYEIIGIK